MVEIESIRSEVKKIVAECPLEELTKRNVRRKVEAALGLDDGALEEKKGEVDQILMEELEAFQNAQAEEDAEGGEEDMEELMEDIEEEAPKEGKTKKKVRQTAFTRPQYLSPQMAAVLGKPEAGRTDVIKGLWAYIKGNDLQDPKDRRFILCDAKLQAVFKKTRVSAFQMAKFISIHLHGYVEEGGAPNEHIWGGGGDDDEEEEASPKKRKPAAAAASAAPAKKKVARSSAPAVPIEEKKKPASTSSTRGGPAAAAAALKSAAQQAAKASKKKAAAAEGGGGGGNKKSGFTRPHNLSDEMAAVVGKPTAGRTEIIKSLWAYIKGNDLQDPADKRFIILDDKLKAVFGNTKRINSFAMSKHISKHLHGYADENGDGGGGGGGAAAAEDDYEGDDGDDGDE